MNDLKTFDHLSSSLDDIASLMCSCQRFEKIYSENPGESAQALIKKLPSVYGTCLKLIAEALIYVKEIPCSIPLSLSLSFSRFAYLGSFVKFTCGS